LIVFWTLTLLGLFEFDLGFFGILLVFTAVYLLLLAMITKVGKTIATDMDSKTGPDRYGI